MRQSKILIPTLKQTPSDAKALSHKMMLRAGYIRQVSAGMYAYLPLAYRIISNIEKIINDEMTKVGASEMLMPDILPAELWKESGRYDTYGPELFKLKNRHDTDFILGPTHEETFTSLIRDSVNSYKKLPLILYQIQPKYRDEDRPRYGLLRSREFIMKDAYSFTINDEDLDKIYQEMNGAYHKIFDQLGLKYRPIIGNGGSMGGSDSIEFSAPANVGEDTIVYSDKSDYAANLEMAKSKFVDEKSDVAAKELSEQDFSNELKDNNFINSTLFIADDKPVLVLTRNDFELNDVKVENYLSANDIKLANDEEIKDLLGINKSYIGPINVPENTLIIADEYVKNMVNATTGANQDGKAYVNVQPGRDFSVSEYGDFRVVKEGEMAPNGNGTLQFTSGIEIGHIFKLGTRYSESLGANVLDQNGRSKPVIMGSYGIGVSRLLSAIAEQNSDDSGLVWPTSIAPFDIHIIPINAKKEEQWNLAQSIDEQLKDEGYQTLIDDRKERPGVKFADSDLIGIPIRVTIGRKATDGIVEVKIRKTGETIEVKKEELINTVSILLKEIKQNE